MAVISCTDDFDVEQFGCHEEIVVAIRSGGKKKEYVPHLLIANREDAQKARFVSKNSATADGLARRSNTTAPITGESVVDFLTRATQKRECPVRHAPFARYVRTLRGAGASPIVQPVLAPGFAGGPPAGRGAATDSPIDPGRNPR